MSREKFNVNLVNLNSILIFSIFSIIIFSVLILHSKYYKHHLFSIIIDLLCLIMLSIMDIKNILEGDNIIASIIFLFIRIFCTVLYSLENAIVKILTLYNYKSTYSLLVTKSIFHFCFLIIFSFPFIFIKLNDNNGEEKIVFTMIADIFEEKVYILIAIVYCIFSFFYNNLCFKIIDVFSPNHFVISRVFENIGIFIISAIKYGVVDKVYFFIRIIMLILLIFSSLIFNEFLIINICGLSKNTHLFLYYESSQESITPKQSEDEILIEIPEEN